MPDLLVRVLLWDNLVGILRWDNRRQIASFQYMPEYLDQNLPSINPLLLPLSNRVYEFPELARTKTFHGLPGVIADSLPEKFGNRILDAYLIKMSRSLDELTPLERLCYQGNRGMGALEFEPVLDNAPGLDGAVELDVHDLVETAQAVLSERKRVRANVESVSPDEASANISSHQLETLITVGTSAGGAKAKAVIAINPDTSEVRSGQSWVPDGFEHWLLKFDETDNEELPSKHQIGRLEFAYSEMAYAAGINMMECGLMDDGSRAHFMTRRFDRYENNSKAHVLSLAGMAHLDRDPPGEVGYERLFQVIRQLGLGQDSLDEMYRRMLFNICSRNQDDHTKNHAFLMFGDGSWELSPAYDLCFSYKPGSRFIDLHQMSCNGKRDGFEVSDLLAAAKMADVKKPLEMLEEVQTAIADWDVFASEAGVDENVAFSIGQLHRRFL